MRVPFLDLQKQYLDIQGEIDQVWREVHSTSAYVGGSLVGTFESEFAAFQGVDHAVGVANGTDALEIALQALGLPVGSEVIVPANSFVATSEAVTNAGLRVRFADIDEFYNLDPKSVVDRITPDTSAIIAVHLYGQPADMPQLVQIARENELKLIEDCAQAHGARIGDRTVGTFGDVATFSFYPGKNLGAYGDGGAVLTSDGEIAELTRRIANHGRTGKYDHNLEGRNSRLDSLQAGILSVKLRHLPTWLEHRRAIADQYDAGLSGVSGIITPPKRMNVTHTYHLYVVRVPDRVSLKEHLSAHGIATGIHYPIALPDLEAYSYLEPQGTPNASKWSKEVLSLPIGDHLSHEQVAHVIDTLTTYLNA